MKPCSLARFTQLIQQRGKSAGALRVSFGIANHFAGLELVLAFATRLRDQTTLTLGEFCLDNCKGSSRPQPSAHLEGAIT